MITQERFDEMTQRCIFSLFDRYWISKDDHSDLYYEIKKRETLLKSFFDEWFRYRLIVEDKYIKLVKTPSQARDWMGIGDFKYKQDYVFLACFIAYLEEKGEGQQFILQDVCDAIINYYPGTAEEVAWTNLSQRLSLIRVIKYCEKMRIIKTFDREIDDFRENENHDMLFETTSFLRYFMDNFYFDFSAVNNLIDVEIHIEDEEVRNQVTPKHKLMRRLFLESSVHKSELSDEEVGFVESFMPQVQQAIIDRFDDITLEQYAATYMITHEEKRYGSYYPAESSISAITTQFATLLWDLVRAGEIPAFIPGINGSVILEKRKAYEDVFLFLKARASNGWAKKYREDLPPGKTWQEVLEFMREFGFVLEEENTYRFYDAIGRVTGEYETEDENVTDASEPFRLF